MKHPPDVRASRKVEPDHDQAGAVTRTRARSPTPETPERLLDFLRAITDNLGEGTYAVDTDGHVTFMNPAAEHMLGWTEPELHGRDMHDTIHHQRSDGTPLDREDCPLLRVLRTGRVERIEEDTFTRRDGTTFPVAYVSSPLMTDGAVAGAVVAFHDISAHKALDEALRRSQREAASQASQLRAVFEAMADAVIVYDREGRISQTNGADAQFFPQQDQPAATLRTIQERDEQLTVRDEFGQPVPQQQWPSARVLRGDVLRGASAQDMLLHTGAGGDIVLNASGAPVRDAEGNIVGGVLIGRDVTQRRRLEHQTREALTAMLAMAEALVPGGRGASESSAASVRDISQRLAELTRAVMGCERVGVITFNLETQVISTVAVAGLTKEQEHLWVYTSSLDDPVAIVERLKAGEIVVFDRMQPPYDQLPNPFGSRVMLLTPMTVGGPLLGVITVDYGAQWHEFTPDERNLAGAVARLASQVVERHRLAHEREEARANALALVETTRRMDEFLSIAAHELRTPVTNSKLTVSLGIDTIRGFLAQGEHAQDSQDAAMVGTLERTLALLERADSHMDRLSRLVVDLLDVSRIRAGKLELRLAPCNLAEIVREVVEEQRQMAPGRHIHQRLPAASRQPPVVLADRDRIRQVVANYLSNALKYSREEQPVHVEVRAHEGWARVSVRDEGPGVPAAEQRRVWERFYRVVGTPVRSGTGIGLGLGLHISQTIVEQHHGRAGLRSREGHGATFWFALPMRGDAS